MSFIPSEIITQCTDDVIVNIKRTLGSRCRFKSYNDRDFNSVLSQKAVAYLGSKIMIHTHLTNSPYSKIHFEYGLEEAINLAADKSGRKAQLATIGNPGHDITINGERYSLKTQAGKSTNFHFIHISKWMELGKNPNWGQDETVLTELRKEFLSHLQGYERILVLRYLPGRKANSEYSHYYELIEIPKTLLITCQDGWFEMKFDSRQNPKPGYCYVVEGKTKLFSLYFDGGGERKLQIKSIIKERCILHATWEFDV
ncbi:hypothetical protein BZG73_10095 [Salinivibrio siamensis]|uniref:Restriction endonuclease n=1 Tax=Salinivibrio siamensis TaxID=414286 RepID=A0ABX3K7W8_9GAMM|nr:hypothetical protein [Salinivibrio siamensis]OOE84210.1 hypothetical protein BZG73_10095 [Salinivibrio siamensis]